MSEARSWMRRAEDSLDAAALLLEQGYVVDGIGCCYAAVMAGVRGALADSQPQGDKESLEAFRSLRADVLGVSPSARRFPAIMSELHHQVVDVLWSPEPEIAARCLEDSREFVSELGAKVEEPAP